MTIRQLDIHSSAFKTATWYPRKQVLQVKFNNGDVWDYENVSEEEANALEAAESQGRYFRQSIRTKGGRKLE